jgi:hypothetical protein
LYLLSTNESCVSPRVKEESKATITKLQQIEKLKQATKIEFKIKSELISSKNSRKTSEEKNSITIGKSSGVNTTVNTTGNTKITSKNLNKNTISQVYNSTTSSNFIFSKKLNTNTSENENIMTDGSKGSHNTLIHSHESNNKLKIQLNPKQTQSITNKSSNNLFLKKKSIPISVSITNHVSKNNSKNNSKSSSRVDEKTEMMRKKIIETEAKKIGLGININPIDKTKKHFTSTNSPSSQQLRFNKELGIKKIITNNIKKTMDKPKSKQEDVMDNILDESTNSVHSSIREANYFKREAEKVTDYIKRYYNANNEYPPASIKLYKIGRVYRINIATR